MAATATGASARPQGAETPAQPALAGELATYREAVGLGTAAFRDGRFGEARAAFERAYAIHPDPVLLFNIASCWRRDGQSVQAVAAYLRFLDLAPVGDPRRQLATETVATLEAELAATAAPPPPPPDVEAEPMIEIEAGDDEATVAVPLPEAPAPRRRSMLRPAGLGLSAVGFLVLAAGGVEAMRASSFEDDVEGYRGHAWNRDEAETYRKGESTARRAVIFSVAGAAIAAGGVTLYYWGRSRERSFRLEAAAGPGGGEVALGGRF